MSLSADSIIDRIKLKEQITKWRAGAILLAVLLGLLIVTKSTTPVDLVDRDYIAKVQIDGLIQQDSERDQILKEISENPHVKAVIVEVNSPGGTMVGSELLFKRLSRMRKSKPVVAVMQEVAASGGYMTAMAANHIFAQEGTITGSIGVLFQTAEVTEMAQKLGVHLITFKSSPLKGAPSPLEKITPEVEDAVNALIKENYLIFVDLVSKARDMPVDEVKSLADGRVYTGNQAVANKLIDSIGGGEEAAEWLGAHDPALEKLPIKDVKLHREKNRFEEIFTSFSGWGKSLPLGGTTLNGVLVLWQPGTL